MSFFIWRIFNLKPECSSSSSSYEIKIIIIIRGKKNYNRIKEKEFKLSVPYDSTFSEGEGDFSIKIVGKILDGCQVIICHEKEEHVKII